MTALVAVYQSAVYLIMIWEAADLISQRLSIINTRHALSMDSQVVGVLCLTDSSGFNVEQVLHHVKGCL